MPIVIILIGIVLIVVNFNALKKNDNSFLDVYGNKKQDLTELDLKIGQIRKDMAESLMEMQQEILELKKSNKVDDNFNSVKKFNNKSDNDVKNETKYLLTEENSVINEIHYNSKTEQIKKLLDMGMSDDQICEKLSLGKGEVQLVKGLYKK